MINDRLSTKGRKEQTATCNPDVGPVFHWSVHGGNIVVPTIERYYRKVRCQYGWAIEVVLASAAVLTNLLTTSYITVVMCLSRRWKRLRGMEGLRMFHFRNSPENGESTRVFPWFSHGLPMVYQWNMKGFLRWKTAQKGVLPPGLGSESGQRIPHHDQGQRWLEDLFLIGLLPSGKLT